MKQTQKEVGYQLGSPMSQCGVCQMYRNHEEKPIGGPFGICTAVTGKITPYGVCKRFSAMNNPYGNVLNDQSRNMLGRIYGKLRAQAGAPG